MDVLARKSIMALLKEMEDGARLGTVQIVTCPLAHIQTRIVAAVLRLCMDVPKFSSQPVRSSRFALRFSNPLVHRFNSNNPLVRSLSSNNQPARKCSRLVPIHQPPRQPAVLLLVALAVVVASVVPLVAEVAAWAAEAVEVAAVAADVNHILH